MSAVAQQAVELPIAMVGFAADRGAVVIVMPPVRAR